jgi:hypothetical protein
MEERLEVERSVLRWGGLAGIAGSILFVIVFAFVGVVIGADPTGSAGAIERFPEIRGARTVENGLYLLVLVLWTAHALALYRALRKTGAAALFGAGLAIVGLTVLAAGALPHAASILLATMYHASDASAQGGMALVAAWHAIQGVMNALLVTGLVVLPLAVISLGAAMRGAAGFGGRISVLGVALGVIGLGAAVALLADPLSPIAVVGFLALIAFHAATGWKVYRIAATDRAATLAGDRLAAGVSARAAP